MIAPITSKISAIASVLPERSVTSEEIEHEIARTFPAVPRGLIENMTGVHTRYFASEMEFPSTFAVRASEIALARSWIPKANIDLLIFASASQDILEPATANIVESALGLRCPVFDVKNACNSFLNGIDIADSFIRSGKCEHVLVCSGETPSRTVRLDVRDREWFKRHFAGYTFGDAGSAVVLSRHEGNTSGIRFRYFISDGTKWDTAVIMGGGARFPRDPEHTYFTGNPEKIRDAFLRLDPEIFFSALRTVGWEKSTLKRVFVHQVAISNFMHLSTHLSLDPDRFAIILPEVGNIASCCIPTAIARSFEAWELIPGDRIALIGFASGFSYGLCLYEV